MVQKSEERKIKVLALGKLLLKAKTQEDIQHLTELLSSFSCEKDRDIEYFLHNRAIEFESVNKSRTYLLCDDSALQKEGRLVILGYITVALKVLDLPENLSNRARKNFDGISAKLRGEVIRTVPCYLIGQLARNSAIPKELSVKGSVLINFALSIIQSAEVLVGGRYVLIECRDDPHLRQFYTSNGFVEFDRISLNDTTMIQMLRPL